MSSRDTIKTQLVYRADIEGLRAVAILLVVAAHAGLPGFEGGFIGVDIFFVLSGYLITGLLVKECGESGRIDFMLFYARRLRRLLPALLVMLVITAFSALWLLPINHLSEQAVAGAAASLWASNLHFLFAKLEYFGAAAESNIYLHTWSLGVEEQFYLVWPLLTVFLIARRGILSNRNGLALGMGALLVISLAFSILLTSWSARYAFYLMPTRVWQFAAGALLFLYISNGKAASKAQFESVGVAGILLITAALVFVGSDTPYPGWWALLPTMGAVCLIFAGSGESKSFVSRILSLRPMQAIGRISYAWYLWHWPVLLLGASALPQITGINRAALIAISVVMAVATFVLVERPIRQNIQIIRRPAVLLQTAVILIIASTALLFYWGNSSQVEASRLALDESEKPLTIDMPIIYQMGCDDWYHSNRVVACMFGAADAKKTAIVMGDSIGLQWFPALAKIFMAPDWKLIVLTKSSCPMVDRPIYYARIGREYTECATWRQHALAYIKDIHPRYVILGSTHSAAYGQEQWTSGTREVLAKIAPYADRIAIMRSTPTLPFNGPDCLSSKRRLHRLLGWEPTCVSATHDPKGDQVAVWLRQAAQGWSNVQLVDMNELVCPKGVCSAGKNGKLIFRDAQHLNASFVESLSSPLAARLGVSAAAQEFPITYKH